MGREIVTVDRVSDKRLRCLTRVPHANIPADCDIGNAMV